MYFLMAVFILGIYYCSYAGAVQTHLAEGFDATTALTDASATAANCPNLLVKTGETLTLYNTVDSKFPPVIFNNIDEYIVYLEKQRESGMRCPVLFLQEENNAQGDTVYRIRSTLDTTENGLPPTTYIPGSVLSQQPPAPAGLPHHIKKIDNAAMDNPPYNQNMYQGFDPYGQNIGDFTKMDDIHNIGERDALSDNPADSNWGGPEYSRAVVSTGKYDENLVYNAHLNTPKN
jgi:hypothetical protein